MPAKKKQTRKPTSVRRQPRAPKAPPVTEKTLGESIIEEMKLLNSSITALATHFINQSNVVHGGMLELPGLVTTDVEKAVEHLGIKSDPIPAAVEPEKKRRGRPTKAEAEARKAATAAVAAGVAAAGQVADPMAPVHTTFPKTCPCGVREDLPAHLHAQGCPVHHPAEKAPESSPAAEAKVVESKAAPVAPAAPAVVKVDDVRGAAIAFIGKHSKERFTEILKGYGATNISTVPPEKLAHLLATLTAGL